MKKGEPLELFSDEYRNPIFIEDAIRCVVSGMCVVTREGDGDNARVLNMGGPERLSRLDMVRNASTR